MHHPKQAQNRPEKARNKSTENTSTQKAIVAFIINNPINPMNPFV